MPTELSAERSGADEQICGRGAVEKFVGDVRKTTTQNNYTNFQ